MKKEIVFTEIEKLKEYISDTYTVRGGTDYTTVYMKNGDVLYFKEDFETINDLIELKIKNKN